MDFTKDADPSGVKALLAQLRNSQAFNEVSKPPEQARRAPASSQLQGGPLITERLLNRSSLQDPSPVAALLAKLQPNIAISSVPEGSGSAFGGNGEEEPAPAAPVKRDFRKLTVQQALPQIYDLSGDPHFVASFKKMKEEQNRLEQKLWDERLLIVRKHDEKLKNARAKAALIRASGTLLQEETKLKQAMEKELQAFHMNVVLPAWDTMVTQQQDLLEKLHVPAMFVTSVESDRTRQERIMKMLEDIVFEADGEAS
ncbi:hypothetical protein CALCODRAFT_498805 [Calocera cornea HHB12733]|uniref:Uncharacterized protein n=1 Tax=Calocera cornea HHB12733 TaxID=1353952 RepID=A0A165EQG0_9BASI|nr:hypothetical protein CALCODRAFT_498805 [Calocera cornea HHB12733]